jgi:hypothetical protein
VRAIAAPARTGPVGPWPLLAPVGRRPPRKMRATRGGHRQPDEEVRDERVAPADHGTADVVALERKRGEYGPCLIARYGYEAGGIRTGRSRWFPPAGPDGAGEPVVGDHLDVVHDPAAPAVHVRTDPGAASSVQAGPRSWWASPRPSS